MLLAVSRQAGRLRYESQASLKRSVKPNLSGYIGYWSGGRIYGRATSPAEASSIPSAEAVTWMGPFPPSTVRTISMALPQKSFRI